MKIHIIDGITLDDEHKVDPRDPTLILALEEAQHDIQAEIVIGIDEEGRGHLFRDVYGCLTDRGKLDITVESL